ncbi:hypothetical protein G3A_00440 [Bacillus sp. 17376]|nr:hypothetical protein G3A_00440 [Bacillus sp. 17376]
MVGPKSKSIADCQETQKLETPPSEALFASDGGVEVSEFLGGDTRQATRGARRWSWTILEVNLSLSSLIEKKPPAKNWWR